MENTINNSFCNNKVIKERINTINSTGITMNNSLRINNSINYSNPLNQSELMEKVIFTIILKFCKFLFLFIQ